MEAVVKCSDTFKYGTYIFTAVPIDDGFSRYPEQAKEFMFLRGHNGRLMIQPTDRVLFSDPSFVVTPEWPTDLKTTTEIYSCE
jgi:hypothetical protein